MSEVLINACLHYGTVGAVEAGVVSVTFPVGAQPVQEGTPNAHWVTRVDLESLKSEKNKYAKHPPNRGSESVKTTENLSS